MEILLTLNPYFLFVVTNTIKVAESQKFIGAVRHDSITVKFPRILLSRQEKPTAELD